MRRILSVILALLLMGLSVSAVAEAPADGGSGVLTAGDIAKLGRPVSDVPTHLTVGSQTRVSGMFFTDMWGNNTSDMDVRTLLHGYSTVVWSSQVQFVPDPMVVKAITVGKAKGNVVYTITLQPDLVYSDGQTPITAKDYVFALLLCMSPEAAALGADASYYGHVAGYDAYRTGKTDVLAGVRLIDDYTFSMAIGAGEAGTFYDLANLRCQPCPMGEIAPGRDVVDTGKGVRLSAPAGEQALTVEGLRESLFGAGTGYMSHPKLVSGPYALVAYDEASGQVDFKLNPYYKGNYEGVKPVIDTLTLLPAQADTMIADLRDGKYDLLNKCVDAKTITDGLALRESGFVAANYARLGYGFCAFACEKGAQQFAAVRQAIAYSVDKDAFVAEYLGGYGMPVYGYYGMGQWMSLAAMGSLRPEGISAREATQWDKLNLEGLNRYVPDAEAAKALLVKDGWTLNASGAPYAEGVDSVRYKKVNGELMPLSIRFAQAEGNDGAAMVAAQLQAALPKLGFAFAVDVVPFPDLLADYYRQNGERKYDMNFMATNFLSVFDPYHVFGAEQADTGTVNPSGLYDQKLTQLALKMHRTQPLDFLAYEKNWMAFQQRYNELLPTLPLYSNVYFDFHASKLQNYEPSSYASWPAAILYAYWGDPMVAEPAATDQPTGGDAAGGEDIVILD